MASTAILRLSIQKAPAVSRSGAQEGRTATIYTTQRRHCSSSEFRFGYDDEILSTQTTWRAAHATFF